MRRGRRRRGRRSTPAICSSPPLARGELRLVGATTLDEYRKHIEKDPALERRFQPVSWRPPSVEDASRSCGASRSVTRCTTGCASDDALVAAAACSRPLYRGPLPAGQGDRPDRRGGRRLRIEIDSMPREIDEVERRMRSSRSSARRCEGEGQAARPQAKPCDAN